MGLSGQIFGFSSASMLIPQALMAVAAVALLYGAVARISGPRTGLLAGAVLALTPVAALMFRFNNPDAVMVLLMTAAAYCTVRAWSEPAPKWLALAGVALGFAFLAKMLEGLMVAPALAAAYLVAAPTTLWARLRHVLVAGSRSCRLGGLVRGADIVLARVVASVYRGFHRQQLHESCVGLQRFCPRPRPQPHGLRPAGPGGRIGGGRPVASRAAGRIRCLRRPIAGLVRGCSVVNSASRSAGWCPPR